MGHISQSAVRSDSYCGDFKFTVDVANDRILRIG